MEAECLKRAMKYAYLATEAGAYEVSLICIYFFHFSLILGPCNDVDAGNRRGLRYWTARWPREQGGLRWTVE